MAASLHSVKACFVVFTSHLAQHVYHFFFTAELEHFLRFTTGSSSPSPAGFSAGFITVRFDSSSTAVMASTCQLVLTLPTGFSTKEEFEQCLKVVISSGRKSFTMV